MSGGWTAEYKRKMREFMAENGTKVLVDNRFAYNEDDDVSSYGWNDRDAWNHTRSAEGKYPGDGCHWVVPEGARLYERTYSMFADTFHGNDDEVGINVKGCHCACGKYTDVILRYTGSLADVMQKLTGTPKRADIEL